MTPSNAGPRPTPHWRHFATSVVSPAILTFALFLGLIFAVVIPTMRANIIDRKREMIRELTQAAWSELADLEARERRGCSRDRTPRPPRSRGSRTFGTETTARTTSGLRICIPG